MKKAFRLIAVFLFLSTELYAVETGPANSVLRVPPGGGRPRMGAVNLASSVAVTGQLPKVNGGAGADISALNFPSSGTLTNFGDVSRNEFLNAAFEIWQRGTSRTGVNATAYMADRWQYVLASSAAVSTVSRSTDVPTGAQSGFFGGNSLQIATTTADASIAAGDLVGIRQKLPGYQWAKLRGKSVTLSFWVKATVTGIYCVAFSNNGNDRSYVAEYTVSAPDTWEQKTVSIVLNPTGGTDSYVNASGLEVRWALASGSTFHATANSWQTGNFWSTANQVNAVSSTSNNFRLAQANLVVGATPAPIFSRQQNTFEAEVLATQSYYEKSYDLDTTPGNNTSAGRTGLSFVTAGFFTSNSRYPVNLMVRKIATPTCVVYSQQNGTVGRVNDAGGTDRTANMTNAVGQTAVELTYTDATASQGIFFQWTCEAEI